VTITIGEVNARTVGALIALFERAVGLYASLVDINAYHQPGVQAGKVAADEIIELKLKILAHLRSLKEPQGIEEISKAVGCVDLESVFKLCNHLAANQDRYILGLNSPNPSQARFGPR
jgi:glucose-6-phosphate isomerase